MAGRKAGTPKTGGRQKGSPNKIGADLRAIAQQYTEASVRALVRGLKDPLQYVAAAKILLAYGHGAPRAAVDVSVKPIYVMSGQPISAEEWAAKYADGSTGDGVQSEQPVDKPPKPRARMGAAGRPAKRAR
jgi:hypothetical protein